MNHLADVHYVPSDNPKSCMSYDGLAKSKSFQRAIINIKRQRIIPKSLIAVLLSADFLTFSKECLQERHLCYPFTSGDVLTSNAMLLCASTV